MADNTPKGGPTSNPTVPSALFTEIRTVVVQARQQLTQAVNRKMVQAYWKIGRIIVEQEQQGSERAEYGAQQLKALSKQLTAEFGKGFDVTNLRNMRRFYLVFPKWETVSLELSWSHYNVLSRLKSEPARAWYLQETRQGSMQRE